MKFEPKGFFNPNLSFQILRELASLLAPGIEMLVNHLSSHLLLLPGERNDKTIINGAKMTCRSVNSVTAVRQWAAVAADDDGILSSSTETDLLSFTF